MDIYGKMIEKYLMKFKISNRRSKVINIITQLIINNVTQLVKISYIRFWNIENIFLSFPCIHTHYMCKCERNTDNLNSLSIFGAKVGLRNCFIDVFYYSELKGLNLSGSIPSEFGNLSQLQEL